MRGGKNHKNYNALWKNHTKKKCYIDMQWRNAICTLSVHQKMRYLLKSSFDQSRTQW
jgi:hypothetical protein